MVKVHGATSTVSLVRRCLNKSASPPWRRRGSLPTLEAEDPGGVGRTQRRVPPPVPPPAPALSCSIHDRAACAAVGGAPVLFSGGCGRAVGRTRERRPDPRVTLCVQVNRPRYLRSSHGESRTPRSPGLFGKVTRRTRKHVRTDAPVHRPLTRATRRARTEKLRRKLEANFKLPRASLGGPPAVKLGRGGSSRAGVCSRRAPSSRAADRWASSPFNRRESRSAVSPSWRPPTRLWDFSMSAPSGPKLHSRVPVGIFKVNDTTSLASGRKTWM